MWRRNVWYRFINVSQGWIASIFSIEELAKQDISNQQSHICLLLASSWSLDETRT
jgi:hypothetical protein